MQAAKMESLVNIHRLTHGRSAFRLCQTGLEIMMTLAAALLLAATTTGAVAGTIEVTGFG